jgi:hypothetical protein
MSLSDEKYFRIKHRENDIMTTNEIQNKLELSEPASWVTTSDSGLMSAML